MVIRGQLVVPATVVILFIELNARNVFKRN